METGLIGTDYKVTYTFGLKGQSGKRNPVFHTFQLGTEKGREEAKAICEDMLKRGYVVNAMVKG